MTLDPFAQIDVDVAEIAALPSADWTPILPVPADAEQMFTRGLIDRFSRPEFTVSKAWRYRDATGNLLGVVVRYDRPANGRPAEKTIRPFTFCEDASGRRQWRAQQFVCPRPLYGLDRLAARPNVPVLVVEGEKAADVAGMLFPDYVAVTSPGGGSAADKADWSPLAGRHVIVWPDADTPGAKYATEVACLAAAAGAHQVQVVALSPGMPEGWDLADPLPPTLSTEDLQRMVAKAQRLDPASRAATWENPDLSLLTDGRRTAPRFDVNPLGAELAEWVLLQAEACAAPYDYVAVSLIAVAAALLANARWPLAGAGWSEPPLLWVACVGNPSSGKSPAIGGVVDLLHDIEERMAEGHDQALRDFEAKKKFAEITREGWEEDVEKAVEKGHMPPPMPTGAEVPDPPVRPRVRVSDTSTEALAKLAAALPRGLLSVRDELAGWLEGFGRYGGGGADRAFALEQYGGRSYIVDRVKNDKPIRIRHLSIGVLGGIQPDRLADALEGADDGLPARFLWCWPDALPGFKLARQALEQRPVKIVLERLGDLPMGSGANGNPEPVMVRLAPEAEDLIEAFARDVAQTSQEACGPYAGALGKARGHALRLACTLEFLWWASRPGSGAPPVAISREAVGHACDWMDEYFLPMAERVFGDAAIPVVDRNSARLARHLKREQLQRFNARTLRRTIGGPFRDAKAMEMACAALVEAGLIRSVNKPSGAKGGRSPLDYAVNPALIEEAK